MSFLHKASRGLKDIKEIQKGLEAMGIDKAKVKASYSNFTGHKDATIVTEKEVGAPPNAPTQVLQPINAGKEVAPGTPSLGTTGPYTATPATTATPSVIPSTAPEAPTKLPLAARKSIRDDFELKRQELESRLSKALGTPWTFFYDALGIYSYSVDKDFPRQNPGLMLYAYFQSATEYVEKFVEKYGLDGVRQLNAVASSHTVTLEPTTDTSISYCSCAIQHSALVILFRDNQLGTNADIACENVADRVNAAAATLYASSSVDSNSGSALNLVARHSVASDWDTKAPELIEQAQKYLHAPTLTLVPNFEANYAKLRAWEAKGNIPSDSQWDSKIGAATEEYFRGFVTYLRDNGFEKDDLLHEGFTEVVEKNEVVLRVVDELSAAAKTTYYESYNGCLVENGTLYIETLPGSWWSNALNATDKLIDRL